MKKIISILSISLFVAFIMSSCKNGIATKQMSASDTVGLAAFQQWKFQQYQAAMTQANPVVVTKTKSPVRTKPVYRNTGGNSGSMSSTSTHTAETVKKRGMSKAAKGAVIGGAGGAVLGAVINKRNRVLGGIIGGILGGGAGYGIGRHQDKKDGRY